MAENEKQKLKAITGSSVEEAELTMRNNHQNRTIRKSISIKEEYYFIVPWQMH